MVRLSALWLIAATPTLATTSSSSVSSSYGLEAPACASAFDARITATTCKADKISDGTTEAASFPTEWASTMMQSLQAGYESCSNCDDSNILGCTMCNMYCQSLEVSDSTADCSLTSEATNGEVELDATTCGATFRRRIAWVTEKNDDYSGEAAYLGKPTQWFASVLTEFHEASQWCDNCDAEGDGATDSTDCMQCSTACELTHSLAQVTQRDTKANNAITQDGTFWMGVHLSQEYTDVARVVVWVAKKGAVTSALVAGMVACVMAALFITRSVRRWNRLKRLRKEFEKNEGRKLIMRDSGRHSYTEFTEF